MIVAVLARHAGLALGAADVFVNVAGGVRIDEPGADLGIALAIASAFRDVPLARNVAAFGEVGLSGEVRNVSHTIRRATEATKLGFTRIIAPNSARTLNAAIDLALQV
jgi:DNA repair protein RadA/Sms